MSRFGAFWSGVANFKRSKKVGKVHLQRFLKICVFFCVKLTATSFCLFLILNLPKKGPKRGILRKVPKIFCFLLIPVLKCLKSGPFCQLFEVQFWTHAITSEGVVTIAPSVLRALRVNSGFASRIKKGGKLVGCFSLGPTFTAPLQV